MTTKVFFIGNPIAGDDGIAQSIYEQLKSDTEILQKKTIELIEIGTMSIELVYHSTDCEEIIIIDAVKTNKETGKILEISEKDLSTTTLFSAHDLGPEQTIKLIKLYNPKTNIKIIGISIGANPKNAGSNLSPELKKELNTIKKKIKELILAHQ